VIVLLKNIRRLSKEKPKFISRSGENSTTCIFFDNMQPLECKTPFRALLMKNQQSRAGKNPLQRARKDKN